MNDNTLLAQFRASPFRVQDEVEDFVSKGVDASPSDVLKLLEDIQTRKGDQELRVLAFQRVAERVVDRSLFTHYVQALRTADPELRAALVWLLPMVNNVAEHPALVALLRSSDRQVREAAARALPMVGSKGVFEMIEQVIREPAFPGRSEAMDCVLSMATQHALPLLCEVLEVGSVAEKTKAIRLIITNYGSRDRVAAVEKVAAALKDSNESVSTFAITALADLADEDEYSYLVGPLLESRSVSIARAAIEGLGRWSSLRSVETLRQKLRLGPNALRLAAITALEAIGTSDVLEPLVDALGHAHLPVRQRAAEALSTLSAAGKLDLARTVIWLLRSRDLNVRRMAGELVQTVHDPQGELWPKLLTYLRDEDWWVRERVMDALPEMAGDALVPHIVEFLSDPSDLIRRFGVDALLRLRAPASLGALVRTASSDPDWWVRERAIEAIAALKDMRSVPHLVEIMQSDPTLRVASLQALADMRATDAAPRVAELLSSEDGDVQFASLRCLAAIDDPSHSSAAQTLLRDPRTEVRNLARELIARWGQTSTLEVVVEQTVSVLDQLLSAVAKNEGDDLILASGRRPLVKRLGRTTPLSQTALTAERVRSLLVPHLSGRQIQDLENRREVDFSYSLETEDLRFRVNVFQQIAGLSAVFRIIKAELPKLDALGLPPVVKGLADLPSGLVLVGGPTGAGKSTTLAAIINHINETSRRHIVTLEDPIEVVHPLKLSLLNQREVGTHTAAFDSALRATLRQDPDVILVGEMRDLPTVSLAITAAETGHLVFGTIHTVSAATCIDRIINMFPPGQHDSVRSLIAGSLRAVLCQFLLPRAHGGGRVLAVEVMLANEAIANLIRKGKTFQIPSTIATSRELGMQLMDVELMRLWREGQITGEEASARAQSKKEFENVEPPPPGAPA